MESLKVSRKSWKKYVLLGLLLANTFVWVSVSARASGGVLSVYFFDVGQGDAILIESPAGGRVLVDGGVNRKILSELGQALPFGDKRIDVVLATHPDRDHIGGLPEVVSRFEVGVYMEPELLEENELDKELEQRLEARGVEKVLARRGLIVDLGGGATLTVLFPDRDVSEWDTNDASVVARLDYGESTFLLTGDAGIKTEMLLLADTLLDTDVLKAGHHGSRTSSALAFLEAVSPEYTVISVGKDNSYGHPHKEVLENIEKVGSAVLSTADSGTIVFQTDGETLWVR